MSLSSRPRGGASSVRVVGVVDFLVRLALVAGFVVTALDRFTAVLVILSIAETSLPSRWSRSKS